MKNKIFIAFVLITLMHVHATAQVPVELFAGHQRATGDVMFFKFFKNTAQQNSRWLFFNRSRFAADYRMTPTSYLPQWGSTWAISYHWPKAAGWAPVAVGQVLNSGVYSKAGVQYAKSSAHFTVFGWVVAETARQPILDVFLLLRYQPVLNDRWRLFLQLETLNSRILAPQGTWSLVQRTRAGVQRGSFQFGIGADFAQMETSTWMQTSNLGGWIRHEF